MAWRGNTTPTKSGQMVKGRGRRAPGPRGHAGMLAPCGQSRVRAAPRTREALPRRAALHNHGGELGVRWRYEAAAHMGCGTALTSLGRHAEALAALERTAELEPRDAGAHGAHGTALLAMRRHVEALEAFERPAELSPGHKQAQTGRGHALFLLGRAEEARKTLERAAAMPARA